MIVYARLHFPSLAVSLIMNGSLFTVEIIANIISTNIHTIFISIESADEAEFQLIRGGKLTRTIRGINDLIERKRALNSQLKESFGIAHNILRRATNNIV